MVTPRKIHFVFVVDGGGQYVIPLVHYIAMKSAIIVNPGYDVYLHTNAEPAGPLWEALSDHIHIVPCAVPDEVFRNPIEKIQHKVDVIRLRLLIECGGIYLDLDTICLRPFEPLLKTVVVMGREGPNEICNAVIMSPPGAKFLLCWLEGYREFHNNQWNAFSVVLPHRLAADYSELIDVEPVTSFFLPSFSPEGLKDLFENNIRFEGAYIYHLWSSASNKYINNINIEDILMRDCTYNIAARPIVAGISDRARSDAIVVDPGKFNEIYRRNLWGLGSGNGSDPAYSSDYRRFVEEFIVRNGIRSVVDIGCGDWQSTRFLNFNGASYTGYDVVTSILEENRLRYGNDNISFKEMPIEAAGIVSADLIIIKYVLQHLSEAEIYAFRDYVIPRYKFCLVTNSWRALNYPQNGDIEVGEFRSLDLLLPPYSFSGAYVHEMWNQWERIRTLLIINRATSP